MGMPMNSVREKSWMDFSGIREIGASDIGTGFALNCRASLVEKANGLLDSSDGLIIIQEHANLTIGQQYGRPNSP
jgi:hypothetical protein